MVSRREFGVAGMAAVAVAAMRSAANAQELHVHAHGEMLSCAETCSDCQRMCASCATHCAKLVQSGSKEHLTSLGTCLDCAEFCSTAAQIVARGGPFATIICKACAEACDQCMKECAKYPDDKHMTQCANECKECAKACREMVEHAGAK